MPGYDTKLYKPKNVIGTTLASDFVHGTDSQADLTDGQNFPVDGNWVRLDDGAEYAIYEYTTRSTNLLENMSLAYESAESTGSYTFSASNTEVTLELAADLFREIIRLLKGEQELPAWLSFRDLVETADGRPADADMDEGLYMYDDHLWFRRRS